MGTVLLTLVRPDTTDSLVIDSLPSRHKNHKNKVISGVHVQRTLEVLVHTQNEIKKQNIGSSPELLLFLWRPVRSEVGGGG